MRRQAVALLVHKDVTQVNALITILRPSFDIYVHIDKKSDITPENIDARNVWKEITVYWGAYNMIEATVFFQAIGEPTPGYHSPLFGKSSISSPKSELEAN